MIGWASAALAAPILMEEPLDGFERCVRDAEAAAGPLPSRPALADGPYERVAVVVGVPCHRNESMPSLAFATRDAVRVSEALAAGGFAVLPLLTVVDRQDLVRALDEAERLISPTGTVLVYFSGHGVLREEAGVVRRYLVMSDTDLGALAGSAVEVRSLELRVDAMESASRVLVQDTCFASRSGGKSIVPPGMEGAKGIARVEPPLAPSDGDLRLYASRFFEQAMESPELGGSVYTSHWLDAFGRAEADLDGDACVGLIEAHRWAEARTIETRDGFQVPQIQSKGAENLLLGCTPTAPTRAAVLYRSDSDQRVTVRGPDGRAVKPGGSLAAGRYDVRLDVLEVDGDALVPRQLLRARPRLDAGEWYDLDEALERFGGFGAVGVRMRLAAASDYGAAAGGLGAWGATRDRGRGRLVAGADAHTWPGGAALRAGEVYGWLGWSWSLDATWGVGPTLGAGALWEQPPRAVGVGPLGQLGARGWVSHGRWVVSMDAAARALLVDADSDPASPGVSRGLSWSPVWTIGIGGRL